MSAPAPDHARYVVGSPPDSRQSGRLEVAVVLCALGFLVFGFVAGSMFLRGGIASRPGWTASFEGGSYVVANVDAALAPELHAGDRLRSVAGDRQVWVYGPALALARTPPGAPYAVDVIRAGTPVTVTLRMPHQEGGWRPLVPNLIVCALLYALGAWIGTVKFHDVTGRLAALNFILTVFTFFSVILTPFPGWNEPTAAIALALANLARPFNLAVGYHFFSRFPQPVPESRRGIFLRWALYSAAALLWIPLNIPTLAHVFGVAPGPALAFMAAFRPDGRPGGVWIPFYETLTAALMALVLARNYRRLRDPDSRRRIRWAGLGFVATLAVFFLFAALKSLAYITGSPGVYQLMLAVNDLATAVIGLSCVALAYAVARHRVLGIHVVIRRGVQYLLARNALRVIAILPAVILLFEAVRYPHRSLEDLLFREPWPFYAALTITGAISLRYRRQMHSWLDRKFFLTEFEQERALVALAERIKTAQSQAEVCLYAAREIDAALHPTEIHVLLRSRNDDRLRVAYSRAIDKAVRLRDWLNESGCGLLRDDSVFSLYEPALSAPDALPSEQLVVPLVGASQEGPGALVLGPKRSEQPYTSRDRGLLKSVATQIALVGDVLRLKERVGQELRVKVQVLGHLDDQLVQLLTECPACGFCYTTAQSTCPRDGTSLTLTLPVEKTIEGKYRLERRIGRGGMGVVYEALDHRLGRKVAVKVMIGDLFGNNEALARFEREARVAAFLTHPNVVTVHDFGRLAAGGAYLAMELVAGKSWRERLRAGLNLSLPQVSHWMKQLCSAVEAAHAKGIVHRDLKPENLMIADDDPLGRVIVLDFGLAKLRSAVSGTEYGLTATGAVMGTRGYMAPEQRAGRNIDTRADVFALAVICAETLTGWRPPANGVSSRWLKDALAAAGYDSKSLRQNLERGLAPQASVRPTVAAFWLELSAALAEAGLQPAAALSQDNVNTLTMRRGPDDGE